MKRLLKVTLLMLGVVLASFNIPEKGFIITGKLKGLKDGTPVYLLTSIESNNSYTRISENKDTAIAKVEAKDGRFEFKGYVAQPAKIYKVKIEGEEKNIILVLGNENVKIKGDLFDWPRVNVSGSKYFPERSAVERSLALASHETVSKYGMNAEALDSAKKKAIKEFVGKHLNSEYAPYLLVLYDFTADEKQAFYDKFSPSVKYSYYGLKLKNNIDFIRNIENNKPGAIISDFNLITSDGKKMSIKEAAAKANVTLLYFWFKDGSQAWSNDQPFIKKTYDRFSNKGFNIINLNIDKNREDWKKGMEEFSSAGMHAVFEIPKTEKELFDLQYTAAFIAIDKYGRMLSYQLFGSRAESFGPQLGSSSMEAGIEKLLNEQAK